MTNRIAAIAFVLVILLHIPQAALAKPIVEPATRGHKHHILVVEQQCAGSISQLRGSYGKGHGEGQLVSRIWYLGPEQTQQGTCVLFLPLPNARSGDSRCEGITPYEDKGAK